MKQIMTGAILAQSAALLALSEGNPKAVLQEYRDSIARYANDLEEIRLAERRHRSTERIAAERQGRLERVRKAIEKRERKAAKLRKQNV